MNYKGVSSVCLEAKAQFKSTNHSLHGASGKFLEWLTKKAIASSGSTVFKSIVPVIFQFASLTIKVLGRTFL